MIRPDEHLRAEIAELGAQCEIACALELLFSMRADFDNAALAADLAESLSERAFQAVSLQRARS